MRAASPSVRYHTISSGWTPHTAAATHLLRTEALQSDDEGRRGGIKLSALANNTCPAASAPFHVQEAHDLLVQQLLTERSLLHRVVRFPPLAQQASNHPVAHERLCL